MLLCVLFALISNRTMDKKLIASELASELLKMMGASPKIEAEETDGHIRIMVSVDDAGFLIGKDGENLRALQHIFQLMFIKKTMEPLISGGLILDINNYYREKENFLQAFAKNTAQKVLDTKKPAVLDPMPAFERRIIHLTIEGIEGVVSESSGEGSERRIIIKPE